MGMKMEVTNEEFDDLKTEVSELRVQMDTLDATQARDIGLSQSDRDALTALVNGYAEARKEVNARFDAQEKLIMRTTAPAMAAIAYILSVSANADATVTMFATVGTLVLSTIYPEIAAKVVETFASKLPTVKADKPESKSSPLNGKGH